MKKATVIARFHSSIETVWNIVTDNTAFDWRSDIVKIEVFDDGNRFTELTKDGFETEFTIVLKKPYERYEFDMKNKNMDGHWIGLFSKDGSGTKIEFTEEVEVANPIMNLFVKSYLKKQQAAYITDLRKAMGE
ncbi:SRPBCC family protein [Oscillibacter sp.]|uniref:SRPBCC family protein n=1 Tax=Oscillibacter sp. TaxID=1945593 RepID=UPI002899372A|nr:SRPBCC family protein [Oscillibacter sp.]